MKKIKNITSFCKFNASKIKSLLIAFILVCFTLFFSGCAYWGKAFEDVFSSVDLSFEGRCKTTDDGFVYYESEEIGLCIISLPDSEDIVIPEYIDGKPVKQLGYKDIGIGYSNLYTVDGSKVKNLTVKHSFEAFSAIFNNLETLTYLDIFYCLPDIGSENSEYEILQIPNFIEPAKYQIDTKVRLLTTGRQYDFINNNEKLKTIYIPEYVVEIDENVFDKISDLTIITPYKEKPLLWKDGWNGNNNVIWDRNL